jgi:hypothetical protein
MSTETGRMRSHLRRTLPLAAGLVAIGALSGGGLVWAHGNATDISACVEPRTGYLVYGRSCGGANITWSQQGPAGPVGQAGPAGPQGAPGPKGAAGKGIEASPAEIQLRNHPPKGLRAAAGKPDLGRLAKLKPSLAGDGVWAFASFNDQDVLLTSLKTAFDPKGITHLDVPAGKYVIFAKAYGYAYPEDVLGFVLCTVVAGADSDTSGMRGTSTLALTVVHSFAEPGRIALRCAGFASLLKNAKITAIRVDVLKNAYVEAG